MSETLKTQLRRIASLSVVGLALIPTRAAAAAHWDASIQTTDWYLTGRAIIGPYVAGDAVLYAVASDVGGPEVWRWTKCDGWQNLGMFTGGSGPTTVVDLCLRGEVLYVAGEFTNVAGVGATNVAKCDLACGRGWSPVGDGTANKVLSITVDSNDKVYIGAGRIDDQGATYHPFLLSLSGSSWATVGGGMWGSSTATYWIGAVSALAADGTDIYVGGYFDAGRNSNETRVDSPNLIKWTGSEWLAMGGGSGLAIRPVGSEPLVHKIVVSGTNVFVAGQFWNIDSGDLVPPIGLDRFSTDRQHVHAYELSGDDGGFGFDLSAQGRTVYLAGQFDHIDSDSVEAFAKCTDGGSWSPLGTGVGESYYAYPIGKHIAVAPSSNSVGDSVYILGQYDHAGGDAVWEGLPMRWVSTSDDFDCSLPATNLVFWVQARGTDVDVDGNGNVTTWYDQSGLGNNLTPYSSDAYTPSASGPAWAGDGAGFPFVGFTPGTMMHAPYTVTNSDWTIFAVSAETGGHYYNWVASLAAFSDTDGNVVWTNWVVAPLLTGDQFGDGGAPQPQGISIRDDETYSPTWTFSRGGSIGYNCPSVFTTTATVNTNGTSIKLRINGSLIETASSGDTNPLTGNQILIGGVDGWSDLVGPIYEVIMYNRVLTSTEISLVEQRLKRKWSTP